MAARIVVAAGAIGEMIHGQPGDFTLLSTASERDTVVLVR
jgi:hypothetical protein